jgi:hypothetical protein
MDMSMTDNIRFLPDGRDQRGRFASGPTNKGRPVGALAKTSRNLLLQVKALGPTAVEKLTEALANGERWSVELILSHVLPANGRTIELHGVTPEDVREALASGDLGPSEAASIATTIGKLASVDSLDELRTRLAELEQALAERSR